MQKRVCTDCTTNIHVASWIQDNGELGLCSFCGSDRRHAVGLEAMTAFVDPVVRRSAHPAVDEELHGPSDTAEGTVAALAGVSKDVGRALVSIARRLSDDAADFYDRPLVGRTTLDMSLNRDWRDLVLAVRHESRYFGPRTREILDVLFGDIDSFAGGVAVRQLEAGTAVYRGRAARSYEEAELFFKAPGVELQAPPRDRAVAGRMNSEGIRVFYAALREEIAVAELRPPVGSHIVVGKFSLLRPLRVLDLGNVSRVISRDPFNPDARSRIRKATFLWLLQEEIGRPVQPFDPPLSYLPTQIIADYVSQVIKLDGIAYVSAQFDGYDPMSLGGSSSEPQDRNVAFFRSAAVTRVEGGDTPAAALEFIEGSARLLDISKAEITYRPNTWAHYVDPPNEDEDTGDDHELDE